MKNSSIILSKKLVDPVPIKKSFYFPKWRNESQEKRISKSPAVKTSSLSTTLLSTFSRESIVA